MTSGDPPYTDIPRQDGDTASSATPRLITDGGSSHRHLFHRFPEPVIYYENEQDTAVVRAVNPAFERVFDVEETAMTDDPLADHVLVEPDDGGSDSRWMPMDAAGRTAWPATSGDPAPDVPTDEILPRLTAGERLILGFRHGDDDESRYFRLDAISTPGETTGGYIVYTGITDFERRLQTLRTRADRLERVVRITAHDLRNPLDVAKIRLEAARDTGEDIHFEKVEGALNRMQQLLQDVRSVGGSEIEPSDGVHLADIAQAAWSTVETGDATLVVDNDLPTIHADADKLQQLFENLFRNAVEHGGRAVTVTVGGLSDGFYTADDGPGIPAADRDRAFEPGYSTADANTGLGLAIVQQIAEDHGWQVTLGSSDAGGARVAFSGVETSEHS